MLLLCLLWNDSYHLCIHFCFFFFFSFFLWLNKNKFFSYYREPHLNSEIRDSDLRPFNRIKMATKLVNANWFVFRFYLFKVSQIVWKLIDQQNKKFSICKLIKCVETARFDVQSWRTDSIESERKTKNVGRSFHEDQVWIFMAFIDAKSRTIDNICILTKVYIQIKSTVEQDKEERQKKPRKVPSNSYNNKKFIQYWLMRWINSSLHCSTIDECHRIRKSWRNNNEANDSESNKEKEE